MRFTVSGVDEVPQKFRDDQVVISLLSPAGAFYSPRPGSVVNLPEHRRLCLDFDDVYVPISRAVAYPGFHHVQAIFDFGRKNPRKHLYVHCYAGVSRSTAAALIALKAQNPEVREAFLVAELLRKRPQANPNPLMIYYSDQFLGTEFARALMAFIPGWYPISVLRSARKVI